VRSHSGVFWELRIVLAHLFFHAKSPGTSLDAHGRGIIVTPVRLLLLYCAGAAGPRHLGVSGFSWGVLRFGGFSVSLS